MIARGTNTEGEGKSREGMTIPHTPTCWGSPQWGEGNQMGLGVPTTPQHHPRFLLVPVHGTTKHPGCVFGSFWVQPCTEQPARADSLAWGWAEQLLGAPRNVSAVRAPEKKPFAISGEALCVSDARLLRAQQ